MTHPIFKCIEDHLIAHTAAIHVGPEIGTLLTTLMTAIQAKKVIEIGTLAGYSALRLAQGMAPGGRLWTLEKDPQRAGWARYFLDQAQQQNAYPATTMLHLVEGKALETLPTLTQYGPFDAVLLDADKISYDAYLSWSMTHLRPGGLMLVDNVDLRGDRLAATPQFNRPTTIAVLRAVMATLMEGPHFTSTYLPLKDGFVIAVRR